MDGLRWILLAFGILLVAGIYCFDRFKRRSRLRPDHFFDDVDSANLSMAPQPAGDDYHDTLAGLNEVLNESRRDHAGRHPSPHHDPADTSAETQGYRDEDQALAEAEIGVPESGADEQERLIVFYLKAPSGQAFAGSGLFEALAVAGLNLGDMGIYHDRNSQGDTIFSIANIFEPGTLDINDVHSFSTRGVALFMQLPLVGNPMDEQDAFERMLGKAEILVGRLGGELHDEHHQPLDDAGVARARAILRPA